MGAIKPWHLAVLSLCCLLPITGAVAGTVWAFWRKRSQPKDNDEA
jgi:cbb3-type cytochrome oxidase subunit 3